MVKHISHEQHARRWRRLNTYNQAPFSPRRMPVRSPSSLKKIRKMLIRIIMEEYYQWKNGPDYEYEECPRIGFLDRAMAQRFNYRLKYISKVFHQLVLDGYSNPGRSCRNGKIYRIRTENIEELFKELTDVKHPPKSRKSRGRFPNGVHSR